MHNRLELPTKEQINAMTTAVELLEWESYIEPVCAKIEVDLMTLSDDDEWHSRARSALAVTMNVWRL